MREYIRPSRALLALLCATTVAATACKKASDTALTTDSTLGRDLAMAARDSAAQPQLKDVPTTPPPTVEAAPPAAARPKPRPSAPKPTTPAPTPKAPEPTVTAPPKSAEPVTGTVAAGTTLSFTSNSKVCTNTNQVGDKFTADLAESVPASNGVAIPAGAVGTFEITDKKTAKNSNDQTYLKVRLISVQYGGRTYPVESTLQTATTRIRGASKATDAKKVAGGAIIGAIAGQIIGKDTKGTVIGAAAGAAAGTAAAAATADFETCLNGGGSVVVKLDSPATVRMAAVP